MNELHSPMDIEAFSDLRFMVQPLRALFGDAVERIKVGDLSAVEDGQTTVYRSVLAVKESIFLELPVLQGFSLGVIRDSEDEWPLIYCEVTLGASSQSLSVQHFPLRVTLANPLLRPVAIEGQGEMLEGFSFEIEGGFTVATDLSLSASLDAFSLPPFEIVGSGLVLALDACRLVIDADDVDAAITGLGFSEDFRGLHAASALLHWAVPLQFGGSELPGIRASIENIALGNQGVSASTLLTWPVVHQGGQFDASQTEMLGFLLDPDWTFALARLQVGIRANVPNALAATGHLRIPFLDAIFDLDIFASYAGADRYEVQGNLRLGENETVLIPLGHADYRFEISALQISGSLESREGFEFVGRSACAIDLPGFVLSVANAELTLAHSARGEQFRFVLGQVVIDDIGQLDHAEFTVVTGRNDQDAVTLESFELKARAVWSDLAGRIALGQVPDAFPLPPDDAQLSLRAHWEDGQMRLSLEAELENVDQLWRFVPQAQRPAVASASIGIALTSNGSDFDGELALKLRLRLPDLARLPGMAAAGLVDLVRIDTGDADGWIDAEFRAEVDIHGGPVGGALKASLQNPVSLAFNLPGLALPRPPLALTIEAIGIELSADTAQTAGEFRLAGNFALRPILPSDLGGLVPGAMAVHLERLLAIAHLYDLVGTAELRLGVSGDGAYCAIDCRFVDAGLEVDLFDMLAGVAAQLPGAAQGSEIDLDIEFSLALKALSLSVGRVPDSDQPAGDGIPFRFGITCELGFAGQFAELAFELGSESLSFGLVELAIPIMLPKLPLARAELDALRSANGRWDLAIWQQTFEPQIASRLTANHAALSQARAALEGLAGSDSAQEKERFELRFRTIPALQKQIFHDTGKKFLTEAILAVYQLLGQLSSAASQASYQQMVEVYQDAVDLTIGSIHFDTRLQFVISNARFMLPFNDPSNIRVEGGASLQGFAPDDPLAPLAALVFKLGLSADAIFFSVEGGAEPIPLPDFGRYPGNAIVFDRLVIGYGYNKNSLLVDFAGELQLSPQLVEDTDTSRRIGVGVRLPTHNKLQFKLDLIPIVLGEVDFLMPLIAFDVDLRSDSLPAMPASQTCTPAWDGLQLIVPGILRADFKRGKFGPFFGPLPAPNYLYAFDIDVGNADLGLTLVCDNYQVITPVLGAIPIPFLADVTPYSDQFCTGVRLAGFGIHFDLRRPFPHPSPLMIFELMGFLADPSLPIDPAGHLAELMWAELRQARIALPPAVLGMFPEQGQVISRELDMRINVATVITLGQQLTDLFDYLQTQLAQAGDDVSDLIDQITHNPPPIDPLALLGELPQALRRLELNGSFVGFEASAVFLLISPDEVRARLQPTPPPGGAESVRWDNVVHDDFSHGTLHGWREVNHGLKRGRGDWTIDQGMLVQNNNVGDNSAGRYGAMLIRETESLSDLRLSVDMRSADDDGMGVVFHAQGETTFYRFRMTAEQKAWQLMRLKGGKTLLLHETQSTFVQNKDYRVRIEARSVPQAGASLSRSLDHRDRHDFLEEARLGKKQLAAFTTHIRIWVNDALWCDLSDSDAPLTEGLVGLDSWWNKGARFDEFVVDRAVRTPVGLTHKASLDLARGILPVSRSGRAAPSPPGNTTAWTADDLAEFNDDDLLAAMPESGGAAVVVTARIDVFNSQVYRFVGVMRSDGRFHLLTRAAIEPLRLRVGGIEAEVPLSVQGRLRLDGRSAGADSWARIEAQLLADWTVLPGAGGALARLTVGSAKQPATLALDSRGRFRMQGTGELRLFRDVLRIEGAADISESHAFVSGHLGFAPALYIVSSKKLLELVLDVEGRLGPGQAFLLAGEGVLKLLGKDFSRVRAELSPEGALIEASLDADGSSWDVNGFSLAQATLALRGRISFGSSVPELLFEGVGGFEVNGARVDGQCRLSAGAADWCLGASGTLRWQGRDWLQGAIELSRDSLSLQGQTGFALDLTPSQLPADIEIANLLLTATVSGSFTVRKTGSLKSCHFNIEWTLAVRLPGSHARQMLPIASQRLSIDKQDLSGSGVNLADLIAINGLTLLPLDGVSIPVPTLSEGDGVSVYLRSGVSLGPIEASLPVDIVVMDPNVANPPLQPFLQVGPVAFCNYRPVVSVPAFDLPIPVLSTTRKNSSQAPLFTVPEFTLGQQQLSGGIRLDQLKLGLKLRWEGGKLGIRVNETGAFHAFEGLPEVGLMSTQMLSGLASFKPG